MQASGWSFWVDRGGTFTDFVAISPQGQVHVHKMLSAQHGDRDVIAAGMQAISGKLNCHELRIGTTLATNALLERKGARCALLVTQGWSDALEIKYQNRSDIYSLSPHKTVPLYEAVGEATERIDAEGKVLTPIDTEAVREKLARWHALGIKALAVSFMHAYRNPQHELAVEKIAQAFGFTTIALSHQVSPRIRYIARTETTTIAASLTPHLKRYTQQLQRIIAADKLLFMQSSGGLCPAKDFRGNNALLSGPAGGVVGAAKICATHGIEQAITFDMGGTSTDIALYDGDCRLRYEGLFQGFLLQTPRLAVHTIAAGGGSLLGFDRTRQLVGPESAGAVPGPICYRNGGHNLTVTDANLMLGRIQAQYFPHVCGPIQNQSLDLPAVRDAFAQLATTQACDPYRLAQGFIDIAIEKMALAVRQVCVENGSDCRQFALFCFGGAGAQLICAIAERLEISKIVVHPLASVLSALGIGLAEETERVTQRLHRDLNELTTDELTAIRQTLADKIKLPAETRQDICTLEMRCRDSDHLIDVKETATDKIAALFHRKYQQLFGVKAQGNLIIENITLEAKQPRPYPEQLFSLSTSQNKSEPSSTEAKKGKQVQLYLPDTGLTSVPVYSSSAAADSAETGIVGPALIADKHTTIVIDRGWQGKFAASLGWTLTRVKDKQHSKKTNKAVAPVAKSLRASALSSPAKLEIFYQKVHAIAVEMGFVLKHAGHSVAIKERLDYSCAIFTASGELLTSAPHIPVHLGSMGECVRYLVNNVPQHDLRDGDAWITNHPLQGGTHLPDITVITPVFIEAKLVFYVASRGHHGDVGGISPGSMPGNSKTLAEDGVIIPLRKIVSDQVFLEREISSLLQGGAYPVRNIQQNLHDLRAQLAANTRGKQGIEKLVASTDLSDVLALAEELLNYTTIKVRNIFDKLTAKQATVQMDNQRWLTVEFSKHNSQRFRLDFSGSCPADTGNFNTPPAVVRSACLYVLRCMFALQGSASKIGGERLGNDIPLNDGIGRELELILPVHSIVNPPPDAAVVAGNVETSQALCDLLFEVFDVCAHAQGTMNNFSVGNANFQYYETIGGGGGASYCQHGRDASQVHMTNSSITDPEVIESLYPLLVHSNTVRRGSGGAGKYRGGDGIQRCLEFLQEMEVNILSQRRATQPQGLHGGQAGQAGRNLLIRADGSEEILGSVATTNVRRGDRLLLETPGGGGWGEI